MVTDSLYCLANISFGWLKSEILDSDNGRESITEPILIIADSRRYEEKNYRISKINHHSNVGPTRNKLILALETWK